MSTHEDDSDQALIEAISRDVIESVAPEELPIFDENKSQYLRQADGAVGGGAEANDEPLGFGVGEAVQLISPYVVAIIREVVKFVGSQVAEAARDEAGGAITNWVKKLFKRFRHEEDSHPSLTQEQLKEVREVAVQKALALRISKQKAETLADSVVGTLAIG